MEEHLSLECNVLVGGMDNHMVDAVLPKDAPNYQAEMTHHMIYHLLAEQGNPMTFLMTSIMGEKKQLCMVKCERLAQDECFAYMWMLRDHDMQMIQLQDMWMDLHQHLHEHMQQPPPKKQILETWKDNHGL